MSETILTSLNCIHRVQTAETHRIRCSVVTTTKSNEAPHFHLKNIP